MICVRAIWLQTRGHGSRGSWLGGKRRIRAESGRRMPRERAGREQWGGCKKRQYWIRSDSYGRMAWLGADDRCAFKREARAP